MNSERLIRYAKIALLAGIYFLTAKFGLSLAFGTAQVTSVWPPTGIALAALLLFGNKYWPGIFLGAFLANITTAEPAGVAFLIAIGNTLEALLGAYWLRRYAQFRISLDRLSDVFGLVIFSGLFSTAVAATIGVTSLGLGGLIQWENFSSVWIIWWIGDMVGALVIAPLILFWRQPQLMKELVSRSIEPVLLFAVALMIGIYVFSKKLAGDAAVIPLTYLFFPFVIWASIRFRQVGAALITVLISAVAIWGTIHGLGPFSLQPGPEQNLISLQLFMLVMTLTGLTLAAIVAERTHINTQLMNKGRDLEQSNRNLGEALRQQQVEEKRLKETVEQLEKTKSAMLNLLEDLEEEKAHLTEAKARIEAMLLSIGEGVIVIDPSNTIMVVNQTFERLTGWSTAEVVGQPLQTILPLQSEEGREVPFDERLSVQVLQRGRPIITGLSPHPHYYVRRDGARFPVAVTVTPIIIDGAIVGAVNVFRDITQEQEVDRAKTEFVSLASHELRTPLTSMRWSLDLLERRLAGFDPSQRKYVAAVRDASTEMLGLIEAFLNATRIELGTLVPQIQEFDLGALIQTIVREMQPRAASKGLELTAKVPTTAIRVKLDPLLIRTATVNLVMNAIKYTPHGTIRVSLNRTTGGTEVHVADSGIGIPKTDQQKIFSRLFRATNARNIQTRGTGLGLYITKAIIELSGGQIRFTSKLGQGTTFTILFPHRKATIRRQIKPRRRPASPAV